LKIQLKYIVFIAIFLFLCSTGKVFAGEIKGTVKVRGLRSPANVLVYLSKPPDVPLDLKGARFVMDQQNLTFIPHVLPIPVGATVEFPNSDEVSHNVFSLSRTKKFNLGSYKKGETNSVLFSKPGVVELRCDVHAEMSAYIMVMKNPYWAITDDRGQFQIPDSTYFEKRGIKGLPDLKPGKYLVKTWHEKLKSKKKTVVVPKNGTASVTLKLTRGVPGVLYKR